MIENKQQVLVLGSGGREGAIIAKLSQSPYVTKIYAAPGNGGTDTLAQNVSLDPCSEESVCTFVQEHNINFVVIGPEAPLVAGISDSLRALGIKVFGPSKSAAAMEGSKRFAKEIMQKAQVKTAQYQAFTKQDEALAYLEEIGAPCVVKADGLAAGKGVFVAKTKEEAEAGIRECFSGAFGESGSEIIIEQMLVGPECSMLVLTDGVDVVPMAVCQDHKRALEGDLGPNTGGMGVYSPVPLVTDNEYTEMLEAMKRTVDVLRAEGIPYSGCLYGGFMLTNDGPYALEFNARFGDPETQVILPRLQSDLFELMWACETQELASQQVEWDGNWAFCVVLTSAGYPNAYQKGFEITGIASAENLDGVCVIHAGTKRTSEGALVTDGGRVLNIVAQASTFEEARQKAYQACELIDFEGKTYRKDIGYKAFQER